MFLMLLFMFLVRFDLLFLCFTYFPVPLDGRRAHLSYTGHSIDAARLRLYATHSRLWCWAFFFKPR